MDTSGFFGRRGALLLVVAVSSSAGALGCSSNEPLKKHLVALETQVTAMRADQDRLEERLAAVELSSAVAARPAPQPAAERVERPRLKVIHLAPEDSAPVDSVDGASAPADSASRRPVIRGTGDRVIKVFDGESGESTRADAASRPVASLATERKD